MKKKIYTVLFSLIMVMSLAPCYAYATDANSTSLQTEKIVLLKGNISGNTAIRLSWNKVGATKYVVYGNQWGKSYKKITTTKKIAYTVKKIGKNKLKAHKYYKFYVKAYTNNGNIKSNTIVIITGKTSGKYANASSITATVSASELTVGDQISVKPKVKIYKSKKHIAKKYGTATRYYSDNKAVATVSSGGIVTAVKAGTAKVYVQDISGIYYSVKITVKDPVIPDDPGEDDGNPPQPDDPGNPVINPPQPDDPGNPVINPPQPDDPGNPVINPPQPDDPGDSETDPEPLEPEPTPEPEPEPVDPDPTGPIETPIIGF